MCHACFHRAAAIVAVIVVLGGSIGCSDPSKARAVVKGKVSLGDKALTAGTVMFEASDNRAGSGTIDANGNYNIPDAPIGEVKVSVSVPNMGGMAPMMAKKGEGKAPSDLKMKAPDGQSMMAPAMDPSKIVQIPQKYGDTKTSGLTYKVVAGEQTKDFNLTP